METLQKKIKAFPIYDGNSGCDYHRIRLPFIFGAEYYDHKSYEPFIESKLMEYLETSEVIVFNPITILYGRRDKYNLRYVDLSKDVINSTTQYYLYGDISIKNEDDRHHIKHCKNISAYPNVHIIYKDGVNLKTMKDSGELYNIYNGLIGDTPPVRTENLVPQ